jgi:Mn2+/Fe2+ NRAMP family transporter
MTTIYGLLTSLVCFFSLGIYRRGLSRCSCDDHGAAYDLCQSGGWRNGLSYKPREAKIFYAAITLFTLAAMGINFIGINPMRALVFAGIVQDFSTPPLMLLIMLMTNRESIMGDKVNGRMINLLGWGTTALIFAASIGLVFSYLHH